MVCQISVFQLPKTQKTLAKLNMSILKRLYVTFWQNLLRVFMNSFFFSKFSKKLSCVLVGHCILHKFKFKRENMINSSLLYYIFFLKY